ncbi:hypothetical protein H0H92_004934 [Tricholoma furcatifolium]|nr:hypothetical protein H0H92_004934 [Tricholoma furcatifolium]
MHLPSPVKSRMYAIWKREARQLWLDDPATPLNVNQHLDSLPPSSPLPLSSSPPIFSSSPLQSSQSDLSTDPPSENLITSNEEITIQQNATAADPININDNLYTEASHFSPAGSLEDITCTPSAKDEDAYQEPEYVKDHFEIRLPYFDPTSTNTEKTISISRTPDVLHNVNNAQDINEHGYFCDPSDPVPSHTSAFDQRLENNESIIPQAGTYDAVAKSLSLIHTELPLFDIEPRKRSVEEEDTDVLSSILLKKRKSSDTNPIIPTVPNPKRSTIASQRLQHKKLSTPFRSPVSTSQSLSEPQVFTVKSSTSKTHASENYIAQDQKIALSSQAKIIDKQRHRTQRASAPFKSPLSTSIPARHLPVRLTPTVQALESKVQLLKRAVKVKESAEEETLVELITKWTEAGRDIAWEVWNLVKDTASSKENQGCGSSTRHLTSSSNSWGWDSNVNDQEPGRERNWGWDVEPAAYTESLEKHQFKIDLHEDADNRTRDTLGTMLMQLGIDFESLGWNEQEGEFQDL